MTAPLPCGPAATAVLIPLRKGFLVFNRWVAAPLIRAGGGPLLTTSAAGSILLLRTTGRKSGLLREAPLGYTVIDGRVVVVAGYGRRAHWFRNALADPTVEVLLPGALIAGTAEEITEPDERRAAFRTLITSMGVVGRLTLGDVRGKSDTEVDVLAHAFPVLAITPTAVRPGPFDPGGASVMGEDTLRIGQIAAAAGVSRRTVDFYTGLGLLVPVSRSGGGFRLYQPADVKRISAIRRLEAQGFRLHEIGHVLTDGAAEDHTRCTDQSEDPCPADPVALEGYLTSLDAQVRALRDLPQVADQQTRRVLTTLVARAQMLVATALVMGEEVLPKAQILPPL